MPQRLRIKRINTVGFVDKGDDPEAAIVFWKRRDDEIEKRIVRRGGEFCVVTEDGSKTLGCHATREAAVAQLRAVEANKRKESPMKTFLKALAEKVGISAEEADKLLAEEGAPGGGSGDGTGRPDGGHEMSKAELEKLQADVEALTERAEAAEGKVEELTAELAEATKEPEPAPEVEKQLEDLAKRATAAEEALAKMRDERERERYIAKAQELAELPGANPDDLGPILRKIDGALDEEQREKFAGMLKAANAAVHAGRVYEEFGSDTAAARSVVAKVESLADEIRKANPGMTAQIARGEVWKQHPELRRAYDAERATQTTED